MYQPKGVPGSSLAHNNAAVNSQSLDSGGSSMDPTSGGNNNASLASKQRLRWTNDLHERFVDAVAQLGGPDSKFLDFHILSLPLPLPLPHSLACGPQWLCWCSLRCYLLNCSDHYSRVQGPSCICRRGSQLYTFHQQNIQHI